MDSLQPEFWDGSGYHRTWDKKHDNPSSVPSFKHHSQIKCPSYYYFNVLIFERDKQISAREVCMGCKNLKCYYLTSDGKCVLTSEVWQWFSVRSVYPDPLGFLICFVSAISPAPFPEGLNQLACGSAETQPSLERPPKWLQCASRIGNTAVLA